MLGAASSSSGALAEAEEEGEEGPDEEEKALLAELAALQAQGRRGSATSGAAPSHPSTTGLRAPFGATAAAPSPFAHLVVAPPREDEPVDEEYDDEAAAPQIIFPPDFESRAFMLPPKPAAQQQLEGEEGGEGGEGGPSSASALAQRSLATAVIRRVNPFGMQAESVAASSLQSSAAQMRVALDPGDRGNLAPSAAFRPAAMQQGYSSGDIADFLRLHATFVPAAEAEWGERGGAYLERRLKAGDFVRCVRRRLQGRDPLTGLLEEDLYGALPALPGAPRRGQAGWRDPWDALLIPCVRRYFYSCLAEGVPPLFSEPTAAQWELRARMAAVAKAYKKERGGRVLVAVGEQWEAYCKLFETTPESRTAALAASLARREARLARAREVQRLLMKKATDRKKVRLEARAKRLAEERKAAHNRLVAQVAASVKEKDEALRAEAARLGVSVEALSAKGKQKMAAMGRVAAERGGQ